MVWLESNICENFTKIVLFLSKLIPMFMSFRFILHSLQSGSSSASTILSSVCFMSNAKLPSTIWRSSFIEYPETFHATFCFKVTLSLIPRSGPGETTNSSHIYWYSNEHSNSQLENSILMYQMIYGCFYMI